MSKFSYRLLFITLSFVGIITIPSLSVKFLPENNSPTIKIAYSWPNTPQEVIEREVTALFEGAISNIKGVERIYSRTYDGFGEIFVDLEQGSNLGMKRFEISSLLKNTYTALPEGATFPSISFEQIEDNQVRLLSYSISSNNDDIAIEDFFNTQIHPLIASLKGVNKVNIEGLQTYYLALVYDENKLYNLGITEFDIVKIIQNALLKKGIGEVIVKENNLKKQFSIKLATPSAKETLYQIPIKKVNGRNVLLRDVLSNIEYQNEKGRNYFRVNGKNTVSFHVFADKAANQISLTKKINTIIGHINTQFADYNIVSSYDSTLLLKQELRDISKRTVLSVVILFFVTLLFYSSLLRVFYLFTALIVSVLIAIGIYSLCNIEIHLYSLLGLTVSFGFIIDNSIIVIDHYTKEQNRKIIIPILAATLTTICPLLIIFSLEDNIRNNLQDFALIIIINLCVSFVVALWFIPALLKIEEKPHAEEHFIQNKFDKIYTYIIKILYRFRFILIIIFIPLLGLPHFLLPNKIDGESSFSKAYNATFGSKTYQETIRPFLDKYMGGTLQLFYENSTQHNFFNPPERASISVFIGTAFGSTFEYIDNICKKFETQINDIPEIYEFHTSIYDKTNGQIKVFLKKGYEKTNVPQRIKGFLEQLAISTGGADYTVFGVGLPFSNAVPIMVDANLVLKGYDYDELFLYATQLKNYLKKTKGVGEAFIKSEPSYMLVNNRELVPVFKKDKQYGASSFSRISSLYKPHNIGTFTINNDAAHLRLVPAALADKELYDLRKQNFMLKDGNRFKTPYLFDIKPEELPLNIIRENQQYQLVVLFNVNGSVALKELIIEDAVKYFKDALPLGYSIEDVPVFGRKKRIDKSKLLGSLVISVFLIFAIIAILFESIKKAVIIVLTIPVSFIGLFQLLFLLEIGFDQGVYAGLLLLLGLLVNSMIFIVHEYMTQYKTNSSLRAYLMAFKKKVFPIIITVLSTIVSLVPYLLFTGDSFWFSFAVTVILGLLLSMISMLIILPIFIIKL